MCKLLTEVVEEHLRTVANHCQRGVVTHSSYRFLSSGSHRDDGLVDILLAKAKGDEFLLKVAHTIINLTPALQLLQLYAVLREPLAVRMGLSQLFLDFAVVVNLAFLGVDEQNLSWLQASFRHHIARLKVHHTYF